MHASPLCCEFQITQMLFTEHVRIFRAQLAYAKWLKRAPRTVPINHITIGSSHRELDHLPLAKNSIERRCVKNRENKSSKVGVGLFNDLTEVEAWRNGMLAQVHEKLDVSSWTFKR